MSVGLSGNLGDFGIADVFQLIGQQRKTGVLELTGSRFRVQLVFDNGAVVSAAPVGDRASDQDPLGDMLVRCGMLTRGRAAQANSECRSSARTLSSVVVEHGWVPADEVRRVEDLLTRDTIFEVLRWESGSFDFRAEEISHERDPASLLGAEQILMDGLRMVDEWQSFAEHVSSEETVFQRVDRFESYRRHEGRSSSVRIEDAERIFSLIDGRLSARRVIDLSRLGTFDGMRVLADLRRVDAIKPLHPEGVRRLRRHARASGPRDARGAIGAVLPLVLLALAVWAAQGGAGAPTPDAALPLGRAALEGVDEAHAARRVENALVADRLARGRWAERIEEVAESRLLPAVALTHPPGRPYYYSRRADGAVFLAPER